MKFWQKTFLCTLTLFLVCLGCGIFAVGYYVGNTLEENYENTCLSEQYYIAKSFNADCEYTVSTGESVSELMVSYYEYYSANDIILAIEYDGEREMPKGKEKLCNIAYSANMASVEGERTYFQRNVDGKRYMFIKSGLSEGSITYIKDISALDEDYKTMTYIFVSVGAAVACVLAILLFLILKRLSSPLDKLTKSTKMVAKGDYTVRAKVSGNDEFSTLAGSFNDMTEQIESQFSALQASAEQNQQLVDNLSHEMRTPLTSIHGYAEYLLTAAASEEEKIDALICIMSESERLSKLSQSLLDISCVGNTEIAKEKVSFEKIFENTEKRFEIKAKEMQVELEFSQNGETVLGDETLIELMVSNFVDNGIKACRNAEKKKVSVNVFENENKDTVLKVKDTGLGMTESEIIHITEPFYRTDKARSRKEGGAGLGLALCRKISDAHGAFLEFKSEKGMGTEVIVTFKGN